MNGKLVRLLFYIVITVIIRFPFFFRDYIDRDESTFILMGQSWVDGFLPYTQLWDLKPPLVFLFFAAIIQFFGKSYIAIRLFGSLVIALTAYLISRIAKEEIDARGAFVVGVLYIYLSSLFGSLQGVMSEHLAMLFFMLGFWQFLKAKDNARLFLSAILFGASLMFRLNLVYPIGLLFIYYLFSSGFKWKDLILKGSISLAGGVLIPFLTFLPYLQAKIPHIWWNSVILASFNYDNLDSAGVLEAVGQLSPFLLFFFFTIIWRNRLLAFRTFPRQVILIWVVTAGMFFMLIKSGKVNSHYLIQVYPFLALLLVPLIFQWKVFAFDRFKPYLLAFFLLLPVEAYLEYGVIGQRYLDGKSLFNGYGIAIPEYIKEHYPDEVSVFFLDYHIGYWELKKLPPSKIVTHPSNLLRPSNYAFVEDTQKDPLMELQFIFTEYQPDLIVSRSEYISFSPEKSKVNQYYQEFLKDHYRLVFKDKKAFVYERIKVH